MILSDGIGAAVGAVAKEIGDLFTSDKERLQATNALRALETDLISKALSYEAALAASQAAVIQAEANGKSWIQRNWRPITMLVFVGLVVARWMGWASPVMSEAEYLSVYELIKIGLGGYVLGRSAEKIAPGVMRAWTSNRTTDPAL